MGIRLISRKIEGNVTEADFRSLLDTLASLYSGDMKFEYDPIQRSIAVTRGGNLLGSVRAEGALHTVVWGVLALAEKES